MDKFLIIDGNNLLFRAYYALPILTNFDGETSNGVFGFCNMLVKAINEQQPKYIAVAFDSPKKNFRHELFPAYKGTRRDTPKDLIFQFPILKKMLTAMNITFIERTDLEADDVIGCLSRQFTQTQNIIYSADKDLLQLINSNTIVLQPQKANVEALVLDEQTMHEKLSLYPWQIVDFKALRGDTSDNIPGVTGVGDKTATDLIQRYGDLDGVYQHADELKGKIGERIRTEKENAYLSKKLAQIVTDKDMGFDLDDFKYDFPFNDEVHEMFKRYQFNSLLRKPELFENSNPDTMQTTMQLEENFQIKQVFDIMKLSTLVQNFKEDVLYFHMAKDQLRWLEDGVEYFAVEDENMPMTQIVGKFKSLFESNVPKILYDSKTTKHILDSFSISLNNVEFDISIAQYVTNAISKRCKDVEEMLQIVGYETTAIVSVLKLLVDPLKEDIKKNQLETIFYDIEMPLCDVLFNMEREGFKIDLNELDVLDIKYAQELDELTQKIYEYAGGEFNINSPKQLSKVLFDDLKLTCWNNKKHKTEVKYLNEMRKQHPIVDLILKYREVFKLHKTYIVAYKNLVNQDTQKIYTVFNQTLTTTGRLSSSEPNLQNIPIRKEEGKNLRKLFIPSFENGLIVSADYSQIELRLLASFSGDEKLIEAFNTGSDIHSLTASEIFGVPLEDVTDDMRRQAKAINFGIIYGISDYGLSQNINTSVVTASEYIKKYFARYPKIQEYINSNVEYCKQNGFVKTHFGRIRIIPEIRSVNTTVRQFGERAAMNMPLQGTASDIIKLAMVRVYNTLKERQLKAKLILQIHDELILDIPEDELEQVKTILKESMENVVDLPVKLRVNIESGKNWCEAK